MDNPYKKGEDIMPPDSLDIRILWKLNRFKFQGIHAIGLEKSGWKRM